jgi:predicted HTH transcriptional regulator
VEKFVEELRAYEATRNSKDYYPKLLREQSKDLLVEMGKFEVELGDALTRLATAIALFAKQVEEANGRIFRHQIFEEILTMNNEEKWEGLLEKVVQLVAMLNASENNDYRFSDLEERSRQLAKLNAAIADVTQRSL